MKRRKGTEFIAEVRDGSEIRVLPDGRVVSIHPDSPPRVFRKVQEAVWVEEEISIDKGENANVTQS